MKYILIILTVITFSCSSARVEKDFLITEIDYDDRHGYIATLKSIEDGDTHRNFVYPSSCVGDTITILTRK